MEKIKRSMITFSTNSGGVYHWDNNNGHLRMPNGHVHKVQITAEPGCMSGTRSLLFTGTQCLFPTCSETQTAYQ